MFDFVKSLSSDGTTQKIYEDRASILRNTFRPSNGIMDCTYNIHRLLEKLLSDSFSYNVKHQCATCEWIDQKSTCIIEINTNPLYNYAMRGLQQVLDQKIEKV
ncbi:hypothetical protein PV325_006649, partial [Microctonus aethiopoides]